MKQDFVVQLPEVVEEAGHWSIYYQIVEVKRQVEQDFIGNVQLALVLYPESGIPLFRLTAPELKV